MPLHAHGAGVKSIFSEAYDIDLTSFDDYDDADDYSSVFCADCMKYAFSVHADIELQED